MTLRKCLLAAALVLLPLAVKANPSLSAIKGNWFSTNAGGEWVSGFYDSICILNNHLYDYEKISGNDKKLKLKIVDHADGTSLDVSVAVRNDGSIMLRTGAEAQMLVGQRADGVLTGADSGFDDDFFRRDSVLIQGYIRGYSSNEPGMIYHENELTGEESPTPVQVSSDGSFRVTLPLNHPKESSVTFGDRFYDFYVEPGDTLTMYIDATARLDDVLYMGCSAYIAAAVGNACNRLFAFDFDRLEHYSRTLSPMEFKAVAQQTFARWEQAADSVAALHSASPKIANLLRNECLAREGYLMFGYIDLRGYNAQGANSLQSRKAEIPATYYDFLRRMPFNDSTAIAVNMVSVLGNQFEYSEVVRHSGSEQNVTTLTGQVNPFLWQVAKLVHYNSLMCSVMNQTERDELTVVIRSVISHPFLLSEVDRLSKKYSK
jgi:hypothetical protein